MSDYIISGHVFTARKPQAGLYIAATPIGNLGDITLRVLEHLAGCDLIACEDTRVTGKLLRHYGIKTPTVSYNEHNSDNAAPKLIGRIKAGEAISLVSDAGLPLVSDPGSRLVQDCLREQIAVVPLPGASAPLTALIASGLPSVDWRFAGFLPSKQGARITVLESALGSKETTIYFESPNRLVKTLNDMISVYGPDRLVCVARELTKLHEEILTASVGELVSQFEARTVKGEIVLLVGPADENTEIDVDRLISELLSQNSVSKAAAEAATLTGLPKRDLYQRALQLKDEREN